MSALVLFADLVAASWIVVRTMDVSLVSFFNYTRVFLMCLASLLCLLKLFVRQSSDDLTSSSKCFFWRNLSYMSFLRDLNCSFAPSKRRSDLFVCLSTSSSVVSNAVRF